MKGVVVVKGNYPQARAWNELVKFAESSGAKLFVSGRSLFDQMKGLVEAGVRAAKTEVAQPETAHNSESALPCPSCGSKDTGFSCRSCGSEFWADDDD